MLRNRSSYFGIEKHHLHRMSRNDPMLQVVPKYSRLQPVSNHKKYYEDEDVLIIMIMAMLLTIMLLLMMM